MRTFIALDLPREAINEIKGIQKILKNKTLFTGKFTEPENLHLTLKFLGEVDENKIEEIKKRLKEIRLDGFYIEVGEVGVFTKHFPEKQGFSGPQNLKIKKRFLGIKIVWIKLNGRGIFQLQKEIDEKLADLFEEEERFMSHLTIARVKYVSDKKSFLEYLKSIKPKKIKFYCNKFYLKKSELKPEGPEYSDIKEYFLK